MFSFFSLTDNFSTLLTHSLRHFSHDETFSNCFEITVELTCCKYPSAKHLMPEWRKNQQSLVQFFFFSHVGIKGLVTDENGDRVGGATVEILGNAKKLTTNKRGEFWRLLLPGRYQVQAWGLCVGDTCKRSKIISIAIEKSAEKEILEHLGNKRKKFRNKIKRR